MFSSFWRLPEILSVVSSDDGYCLPAWQQPISLAEIANLEVADRDDIASVDDNDIRVKFRFGGLLGDNAHLQQVLGIQSGGGAEFNNPHSTAGRDQRLNPADYILAPIRTVAGSTTAFAEGPGGDKTRLFNSEPLWKGGVSGDEWR